MRTTKPISTITYNSPAFLRVKLDELVKAQKIAFWAFIQHKPEEDEKKSHIHLYCEPAKIVQTEEFKEFFKEPDKEHPYKPLTCISWQSSKFDDWYEYSIHDERYLASKGQSRHFHYEQKDVISSDEDDLEFHISQIDMIKLTPYQVLSDAFKAHKTFADVISSGAVPIQQIRAYQTAWEVLKTTLTRTSPTHTPKETKAQKELSALVVQESENDDDFAIIDPETGEVIEKPASNSDEDIDLSEFVEI